MIGRRRQGAVVAAMVAVMALAAARPAAADPPAPPRLRWWSGFGVWIGYREVTGVGRASGRSLGMRYHLDLGDYGVDVAALNLQRGHDEGIQTAVRAVAFIDLARWLPVELWSGAGVSYGWAKGWNNKPVPRRTGRGAQLELLVGLPLVRLERLRLFAQAAMTVPLYSLRDPYRSSDSEVSVIGYELALGIGF
jgi:hypothetical protein